MTTSVPRSPVAVTVLLVLSLSGCSDGSGTTGEPIPPAVAQLQEVGEMLRAAERPPTKVSDLAKAGAFYGRGFAAVKSGDIVVVWGARMAGEGEASGPDAPKGVVAYEKKTPSEGGYVLLQDGTVDSWTAETFRAAPKAS